MNNEPINIYGDGSQTRDFVYVGDVVDNIISAMQILKHDAHVVNICSGQSVTINHLAELLAELFDQPCNKNYQHERPSDAHYSYGSTKKMHEYGFTLQHDLRHGLIKTIEYFKGKENHGE